MRIYGNRRLKTLPGRETRPTSARVREAVFNIWQGKIEDCRWLDLCAGNGSMGAEALCRGAASALAIERSPKACQIIAENWQQVAREGQEIAILRGDIRDRLPTLAGQHFDRIYFDPPYRSNLYSSVLEAIAQFQLLAEGGQMAVEHDPGVWTPWSVSALSLERVKVYGNSAIALFARDLSGCGAS